MGEIFYESIILVSVLVKYKAMSKIADWSTDVESADSHHISGFSTPRPSSGVNSKLPENPQQPQKSSIIDLATNSSFIKPPLSPTKSLILQDEDEKNKPKTFKILLKNFLI